MIKNVTKYESRVAALTSDLVVPKPLLLVCKEEVVNLESVWKSRETKKKRKELLQSCSLVVQMGMRTLLRTRPLSHGPKELIWLFCLLEN